jgi:hypothetical protein
MLPLALAEVAPGPREASAQSSVFTYQANVQKNGSPVNDTCSFLFKIFGSATGSDELAASQPITATVTDGLVSGVYVDFTDQISLSRSDLWLEVTLMCPGDASGTTLAPRQRLLGLGGGVPPGTVAPFAGQSSAVPPGWELCDGRPLPKTGKYGALFAAIGVAHGASSDGTMFYLPDYRGLFLRGVDDRVAQQSRDPDAAKRTPPNPGGNAGPGVGSLQLDAVGPHVHLVEYFRNGATAGGGTDVADPLNPGDPRTAFTRKSDVPKSFDLTQRVSSETRPVNAYVNWIIKY